MKKALTKLLLAGGLLTCAPSFGEDSEEILYGKPIIIMINKEGNLKAQLYSSRVNYLFSTKLTFMPEGKPSDVEFGGIGFKYSLGKNHQSMIYEDQKLTQKIIKNNTLICHQDVDGDLKIDKTRIFIPYTKIFPLPEGYVAMKCFINYDYSKDKFKYLQPWAQKQFETWGEHILKANFLQLSK